MIAMFGFASDVNSGDMLVHCVVNASNWCKMIQARRLDQNVVLSYCQDDARIAPIAIH